MISMTVTEFISALGTSVTNITYNKTVEGITFSSDGLTANIYNIKLNGAFSNTDGYKFPTTLITADLRGLNIDNVTSTSYMFDSCTNLTTLDLSNFNTSNISNYVGMFNNDNITKVYVNKDESIWTFGYSSTFGKATSLKFFYKDVDLYIRDIRLATLDSNGLIPMNQMPIKGIKINSTTTIYPDENGIIDLSSYLS